MKILGYTERIRQSLKNIENYEDKNSFHLKGVKKSSNAIPQSVPAMKDDINNSPYDGLLACRFSQNEDRSMNIFIGNGLIFDECSVDNPLKYNHLFNMSASGRHIHTFKSFYRKNMTYTSNFSFYFRLYYKTINGDIVPVYSEIVYSSDPLQTEIEYDHYYSQFLLSISYGNTLYYNNSLHVNGYTTNLPFSLAENFLIVMPYKGEVYLD